jgi:hypothetical protein
MEFEPVSIDSARAALDEVDESMAALVSKEYWEKVRRAPLATDRALTGRTMTWLGSLPAAARPQVTIERYPRIVNALAAAWNDVHARGKYFEHLLNDRRRGRRGFPLDVERELKTLHEHARTLTR